MAKQIVSFHLNDAGDQVFVYSGASDEMRELEAIIPVSDSTFAEQCGDYVRAAVTEG